MKKAIIVVASVLAVVAITSMTRWLMNGQDQEDVQNLTIAEASQAVFALVYIADAKGFFADEGLNVTFNTFSSGKDALHSVVEGDSDIGTVYETPVVFRSYQGEDFSIVSTLHNSSENTGLVALKSHGIVTSDDLSGKSIAVTKGTNGEFFLSQFLTSQGISLADVNLVDTRPQDMADAIGSGSVDAIATWNPHLYKAEQALGEGNFTKFLSDAYTELSMLVGMRDFVATNPVAMERLVKSIVRAEEYLNANQTEAIDIVVRRLSSQSEETIRATWNRFNAQATLNNVLLTVLQQEGNWLRDEGLVQGKSPDFTKAIASQFLRRANPESVTVR